jgi:hypothetical protein
LSGLDAHRAASGRRQSWDSAPQYRRPTQDSLAKGKSKELRQFHEALSVSIFLFFEMSRTAKNGIPPKRQR